MRNLILALLLFFPLFGQVTAQGNGVSTKPRTFDRKFAIVSGLVVGATVFDYETTHYCVSRVRGCREVNGVMAPFVSGGRLPTYVYGSAMNAGVLAVSYKLKQRGSKWWWVLPAANIGAHVIAGSKNMTIIR